MPQTRGEAVLVGIRSMATLLIVLVFIAMIAALMGDTRIVEAIKLHGLRLTCAIVGTAVILGSTLLDVDVAKPTTESAIKSAVQIHQIRPMR